MASKRRWVRYHNTDTGFEGWRCLLTGETRPGDGHPDEAPDGGVPEAAAPADVVTDQAVYRFGGGWHWHEDPATGKKGWRAGSGDAAPCLPDPTAVRLWDDLRKLADRLIFNASMEVSADGRIRRTIEGALWPARAGAEGWVKLSIVKSVPDGFRRTRMDFASKDGRIEFAVSDEEMPCQTK